MSANFKKGAKFPEVSKMGFPGKSKKPTFFGLKVT
jgi:hypothetical protein